MTSRQWYTKGKVITLNNFQVFFNREGRGEPLFCIHGFPSSSWDFAEVWPALKAHFDLIAHDLIGLGKSSKPNTALTVSLQADVVEALALRLGIKRAHILAHDLGNTVAQELLARQLSKSSKIEWLSCIFMNGGIFAETHRPLLVQKLLLSKLGPLFVKFMFKHTFTSNLTKVFSEAHPPSQVYLDTTWQLTSANNGLSMIPRLIHYMKERQVFRDRWVNPLVQNIIPLRLINGIEDPISGQHLADHYAKLIPNADIVLLQHTGHYPHIEQPHKVVQAVLEFHKTL